MFGQIAGGDHPGAVVDGAGDRQLAHRGIDQLHAGAPLFPGLSRRIVARPGEPRPFRFPRLAGQIGPVVDQMTGKIAPGQFFQKRLGPPVAPRHGGIARMPDLARADLATGQVFRQARCGIGGGQVACCSIIRDLCGQKRAEAVHRRRLSHPLMAGDDSGTAIHCSAHLPVGQIVGRRPDRRAGQAGRGGQRLCHRAAPDGVPERGEHAVRPTCPGHHGPGFVQHMARVACRGNPRRLQRRLDSGIARPRCRVVQPTPMDRRRPGFGNHRTHHRQGRAAPQDQTAAPRRQHLPQLRQPKAQPPFRRRPQRLDTLIQNEQRDHRLAAGQSRHQRRIVGQPQVAPDPPDSRFHGSRRL